MVRNTGLTLECTFSNPSASIAAPTTMNVTIKVTPNDGGSTEQFVPTTENWVLTDMYITAAADSTTGDPMVQFIKDRGITMGTSGVLSTSLVTNNTRPRFLPSPIGFEGGTILSMQCISTVDFVTAIETGKFYVAVDIT
jgi:hypothetical protein